jgi:hypothetical protein
MSEFILPKDIPLDRYPGPEVFLAEGKRIVEAATAAGLTMRVMGPLALHYYFPEQVELYARLERLGDRYFTDIDFASYGRMAGKMRKFMEGIGYECDLGTFMSSGGSRHIYYAGRVPMIDVFFEKLDYCHEVNYKGRLELDEYSVSLSDVMLQKLQIWEINDKDLKDIEYLLTTAEIGDDDYKKINQSYIAKRFSDDWGFWYTATTNFGRVKDHVDKVDAFTSEQKQYVKDRCDAFLARIEAEPKTKGWNKRAKKGTSKLWYNEVSDW